MYKSNESLDLLMLMEFLRFTDDVCHVQSLRMSLLLASPSLSLLLTERRWWVAACPLSTITHAFRHRRSP